MSKPRTVMLTLTRTEVDAVLGALDMFHAETIKIANRAERDSTASAQAVIKLRLFAKRAIDLYGKLARV